MVSINCVYHKLLFLHMTMFIFTKALFIYRVETTFLKIKAVKD